MSGDGAKGTVPSAQRAPSADEPVIQEETTPDPIPAPTAPSMASVADELRVLKSLVDDGIINQDDFDAKKAKLLGL